MYQEQPDYLRIRVCLPTGLVPIPMLIAIVAPEAGLPMRLRGMAKEWNWRLANMIMKRGCVVVPIVWMSIRL
jgi:hypothetical protein